MCFCRQCVWKGGEFWTQNTGGEAGSTGKEVTGLSSSGSLEGGQSFRKATAVKQTSVIHSIWSDKEQQPQWIIICNSWTWLYTAQNKGNGNTLQHSCRENPMDREASWATICGVSKSQTQLSDWALTQRNNLTIINPSDQNKQSTFRLKWVFFTLVYAVWPISLSKSICLSRLINFTTQILSTWMQFKNVTGIKKIACTQSSHRWLTKNGISNTR